MPRCQELLDWTRWIRVPGPDGYDIIWYLPSVGPVPAKHGGTQWWVYCSLPSKRSCYMETPKLGRPAYILAAWYGKTYIGDAFWAIGRAKNSSVQHDWFDVLFASIPDYFCIMSREPFKSSRKSISPERNPTWLKLHILNFAAILSMVMLNMIYINSTLLPKTPLTMSTGVLFTFDLRKKHDYDKRKLSYLKCTDNLL